MCVPLQKKPEANIFRKVLVIIVFPLFASLYPILHPIKSYVEMTLQNLRDQWCFSKEKGTSQKYWYCGIVYFSGLEDAVTVLHYLGAALPWWGQQKVGAGI